MNEPLVTWVLYALDLDENKSIVLDSMIHQTYVNMELFVAYDKHDNIMEELLIDYKNAGFHIVLYPCEKYINKSIFYNKVFEACSGHYIAFMKEGIINNPDRIKKQVEYLEMNPSIGILGSTVRLINDERKTNLVSYCPESSEEIRCWLLFGKYAEFATVMIRKSVIQDNKVTYPDDEDCGDYLFFCQLTDSVSMHNSIEPLVEKHIKLTSYITTGDERRRNKRISNISREYIERTFDINTSSFEDSIFGKKSGDIPFAISRTVESARKVFSEILAANVKLNKYDPILLDKQLRNEYSEIKEWLHINHFNDELFEVVLQNIDDLEFDIFKFIPRGNALIYGTGSWARDFVPEVLKNFSINVLAYCDSDESKRREFFYGNKVISPNEIVQYDYDYIFIATPLYEKEIRHYLIYEKNVNEDCIYDFRMLIDLKFLLDRNKWMREYSQKRNNKKVYLFGAPDYSNIGDHAIAYAEEMLIKNMFDCTILEVPMRLYSSAVGIAGHYIESNDLILITGGGFLGSLWFESELMVRDIVERFKDNRIIVLPQTLYWGNEVDYQKEITTTKNIYLKHDKLTLCARDYISKRLMERLYSRQDVIMAPDMVLAIDWSDILKEKVRYSILLCLKSDKESILQCEEKQKLNLLCKNSGYQVVSDNNMLEGDFLYKEEREQVLVKQMNKFSASKLCVTDRLHGMLFSVITRTPCIVLGGCNHKLEATYKWIDNIPYVYFADSINNIDLNLIIKMINADTDYDYSDIKKEFKTLTVLLREELTNGRE